MRRGFLYLVAIMDWFKPDDKQAIVPVPDDAPKMTFKHPKFGGPSKSWPCHDAEGRLVGYVARFDYQDAEGTACKDYMPITYCALTGGKTGWRAKGIPDPRPLVNLPGIISRADVSIIIAEGEKAAARLTPIGSWPDTDSASITFMAGYPVVPDPIRAAILLRVAHMYEHRESVVIGESVAGLPLGEDDLLRNFRLWGF